LPTLSPDRKRFTDEADLKNLREKIRAVYRMAGIHGRTNLVLGVIGAHKRWSLGRRLGFLLEKRSSGDGLRGFGGGCGGMVWCL
jgi:hypothetical protein